MAADTMIARMMSDVQFLARQPHGLGDHAIYLYRKASWVLKPKVRDCILTLAQDRNWIVLPQEAGLYESAVFDDVLFFRDLGQKDAYQPASEDLESSLFALAAGVLDRHVFLMVPTDHPIIGTNAWERAISASNVTYIEESLVTRANLAGVLDELAIISDLSQLSQLVRTQAFIDHFSHFVPENGCTVSEISMEIDRFVLLPMARATSQKRSRGLAVRRRTIDIVQKGFLDGRNEAALSEILVHLDGLLFTNMLDRSEVIARLYAATASIVGGRDRRYKNRDIANLEYYVWGMLLLSCDWSGGKYERGGGCLVAFEKICREFMTIANPRAWLRQTDRWQRISVEIARPANADRGKLERARLDLMDALRERSALLGVSHRWLEFPAVEVA